MNEKTLSIIIKATDKASSIIAGVGDKMVAFAKTAALAGAAATAAFGVNAVKAAIDLGESMNAVEKTFGAASGKIIDFGKTASQQAGLSRAAFHSAVVPIGAMLQNMGFDADKAADSSINLGKRAADLASVFNTSLDDALTAIQAGLRGEADPLERFGVGLSQTAVKAYAVEQGLIGAGDEMDTTTAATARLGLFMQQTTRFAGDFADTSDEAANKARILKAEFENKSAVIGEKLLPAWNFLLDVGLRSIGMFEGVYNWVIGIVPAVQNLGAQIGDYLGPKFIALWDSIQNKLLPILNDLWHNVIEPLMPVLGVLLVAAIGLVIDAVKVLIDGFSWLYKAILDGNPIIWGLIGIFGTLAAAMAFNAVFNALTVGFATLQLITIPSVMASIGALRGLLLAPIAMPAIAVGAAIAALMLVVKAIEEVRGAVSALNSEAQAKASAHRSNTDAIRRIQESNQPVAWKQKKIAEINASFSSGGFTGIGGKNQVAGIVHKGEYVLPQELVDQNSGTPKIGSTFNMYGNFIVDSDARVNQVINAINAQKEMGSYGVGI